MRKIIRWTVNVLVLCIAFIGIMVFIGTRRSEIELLTVLSPSMSPSIPMGSVVLIRPVDAQDIRVGDVITYRSVEHTGRRVTHRVVEVLDDECTPLFLTQGDSNNSPDNIPIHPGFIRGKVTFTLPLIGYLIQFIRKPMGFTLVIGIPALLVLVGEVQGLLNLKKQKERTAHADD